MIKVFLGGTCNGSTWRDRLIPLLDPSVNYFDPVVPNWDEQAQQRELQARADCDICLYVITPKATGVYSIAEVVDDSNKRPHKTMLCVLQEDDGARWTEHQAKSLRQVEAMVFDNGGTVAVSLRDAALHINARQPIPQTIKQAEVKE